MEKWLSTVHRAIQGGGWGRLGGEGQENGRVHWGRCMIANIYDRLTYLHEMNDTTMKCPY